MDNIPVDKQPDYEVTRRRCLMCGGEFDSSWPGERVCKRCRSSHNWRQGVGAATRPMGQATQS